MFEDPLQLCPIEKWPELEDVFKADCPRSICGLLVLQTQRYIFKCGFDHGCKVYCPYGDGRNGFVSINIKKGLYEVIVQCPTEDTSTLEKALKTTSIIDWDKEIETPFVPKHVMRCIEQVIEKKNVMVLQSIQATTYMLDKTASLFNATLPPGFNFDLLSLEHVSLIESTWPHRYDGCNFTFELVIKAKLGYGLFKEKKLVCWILRRETGTLLHLFTLENERRKGYGELVLKLMSNILLKDDKYVVAICTKENINAAKLYQKLNFQLVSEVDWCTLTRKPY